MKRILIGVGMLLASASASSQFVVLDGVDLPFDLKSAYDALEELYTLYEQYSVVVDELKELKDLRDEKREILNRLTGVNTLGTFANGDAEFAARRAISPDFVYWRHYGEAGWPSDISSADPLYRDFYERMREINTQYAINASDSDLAFDSDSNTGFWRKLQVRWASSGAAGSMAMAEHMFDRSEERMEVMEQTMLHLGAANDQKKSLDVFGRGIAQEAEMTVESAQMEAMLLRMEAMDDLDRRGKLRDASDVLQLTDDRNWNSNSVFYEEW